MTYRIIGQERIKTLLLSAIEKNRLAHAYLFHGQPGTGKDAVALGLALHLNCQRQEAWGCGECPACRQILNLEHPAYQFITPVPSRPAAMKEKKGADKDRYQEILRERTLARLANPYLAVDYAPELTTAPAIGIDEVRGMKSEVLLKLGGQGYRIFHVSGVERMSEAAANSLLKLLEEPPARTLIVLTTAYPNQILETIHSRCQSVHFQGLAPEQIEDALTTHWDVEPSRARFLSRLSGGSLQRALIMGDTQFEEQRQVAVAFLELCLDDALLPVLDWVETQASDMGKVQTLDMLRLLQVLIRDLLQIRLDHPARVINTEAMPLLQSLLGKRPHFMAEPALAAVSQAIDYIEKNAYLPLALFTLARRLHEANVPA